MEMQGESVELDDGEMKERSKKETWKNKKRPESSPVTARFQPGTGRGERRGWTGDVGPIPPGPRESTDYLPTRTADF